MGNKRILIFVDTREFSSEVPSELKSLGCSIERKVLDSADYICSDRVGIERKTTSDFISSVIDQRIWKQLNELKSSFEKPILIIQGNTLYANENVHPNAIRGALISIALDFEILIVWARHSREVAEFIYAIAKREQLNSKRSLRIRSGKKPLSIKEKQEFLVSGFSGLSSVRAKNLLKHFGSPLNIFNASESELMKVKQIGKKFARRIREILDTRYK
jgi:Fanconi anemia group M protein